MGVKHLWTVLTPFCDRKPLYELQGKTVAVDLSCWICEAQNIAEYQVQPRMYLRNLYFRTCYLLLMGVNPVFVLEGKAPELKYDTISARNAIQFKGAKPKTDKVKTGKDRSRFHFVLKQCEEMLRYMGLACIKGNGEAESLCAYLNEDGLVDGCISQDSDCFAYGAHVVYRNFSISTQGVQAASGGAVDIYDIRKVNKSLNFGRNKIVAMALLIGCDYSEGVHGVGKDSVLKFFDTVSDEEVLDRLRSWRTNTNMYEEYEKKLADKNICTSCGHTGKITSHTKNGCISCKTTTGCNPFHYKDERLNIKNELNMRNKAIKDPNFPDEILIKEFLHKKDNVKELDLKWKQPNVVGFIKFTTKFLQWEELYAFEKILPVLTRWQCRNPELLNDKFKLKGILKPDKIKKVRNPKGVPSYEVIWSDPEDCFKGIIPESQLLEHNVDLEKLWSSIEPQDLLEKTYPELVEEFKQSKIKPKKTSKRKKDKDVDKLTKNLGNVSITEPKVKKSRKPRLPKAQEAVKCISSQEIKMTFGVNPGLNCNEIESKNVKQGLHVHDDIETDSLNISLKQLKIDNQKCHVKNKIKTLDSFVKKSKKHQEKDENVNKKRFHASNVHKYATITNKSNSSQDTHSTPLKNVNFSFNCDMSALGSDDDGDDDLEVSDIINDIVSRNYVKSNLKRLADKYIQDNQATNVEVVCLDDSVDQLDKGSSSNCHRQVVRNNTEKIYESLCSDDLDKHNSLRFKSENIVNRNGGRNYDLDGNTTGSLKSAPEKNEKLNKSRTSCFFIDSLSEENDLFEKTFNATFKNFSDKSSDGSETEEYDLDESDVKCNKETRNIESDTGVNSETNIKKTQSSGEFLSSDEDSFCNERYVPLYERLKSK